MRLSQVKIYSNYRTRTIGSEVLFRLLVNRFPPCLMPKEVQYNYWHSIIQKFNIANDIDCIDHVSKVLVCVWQVLFQFNIQSSPFNTVASV